MELLLRTLIKLSLFGSLLAMVLTALRPLLRGRVSRAAAYYLWLLVLLRLCVPVGVGLPVPVEAAAGPEPVFDAAAAAPVEPPDTPAAPPEATATADTAESGSPPEPFPPSQAETALPAAPSLRERLARPELWAAVWAVGAALSAAWFALGYLRVSRAVRRSAGNASPAALAVLRELDPAGRVRLVENPAVNTPLLLGAARPMVVLPVGVTDPARLRDILRHELTHVRRHDLLFKWFAAAATSLHWFNPVMLLVRREIGRACELSCDEAVMRHMDEAGRRHYGETLLALAAHAPKGLGPMAAMLCEEKKQLKERLFCIVKYKKSGPMVIFLSLLLAAVLGACALVTGVTPVEADPPEPDQTAEPEDAALYELDGGLDLAIPSDIADQILVLTDRENWQGAGEYIMSAYEKQSYEDAEADMGYEMGYLFGITRYTQAQYEQAGGMDGAGGEFFAAGGGFYYMHTFATDFQFYRVGNTYTEEDLAVWDALEARIDSILKDFIARNGLEPYKTLGAAAEDLYRHITDPRGDGQYDFTARVEHSNKIDEFHITPNNGYNVAFVGNYFFTYTWQEAAEGDWLARDYWGTVLTLTSADGNSSIRCRSADDVVELVQDGVTRYARVWDPEAPEDPDPYLWPTFWAYLMNIPDDAYVSQPLAYTADGSLSPAEAAQRLSELWAEHERDTPDWLDWKPLDFQVASVHVFDVYNGEDDPNFCFDADFRLLLDNPNHSRWQAGAGLEDPIADGPFAGYYGWGREVLVAKNSDGDWFIADYGTGGYLVDLPGWTLSSGMANYIGNAPLEELVNLFFLTEGHSHEDLLPMKICEKPPEELAGLNGLLSQHTEAEVQELCRALAAYLNAGFGASYEDTLTSVEDLNALLDPAYRAYTADVPPLYE